MNLGFNYSTVLSPKTILLPSVLKGGGRGRGVYTEGGREGGREGGEGKGGNVYVCKCLRILYQVFSHVHVHVYTLEKIVQLTTYPSGLTNGMMINSALSRILVTCERRGFINTY